MTEDFLRIFARAGDGFAVPNLVGDWVYRRTCCVKLSCHLYDRRFHTTSSAIHTSLQGLLLLAMKRVLSALEKSSKSRSSLS